jgi:hypothetical protein
VAAGGIVTATPEQLRAIAYQLRTVAAEVSHQDVATASALVGLARTLVARADAAEVTPHPTDLAAIQAEHARRRLRP